MLRKIASIILVLLSLITVLAAFYSYNQQTKRKYTSFSKSEAAPIQKLIDKDPEYFHEEEQRSFKISTNLEEVSEELKNRGKIIRDTNDAILLILPVSALMFLIGIYFLVISFQNSSK